MNSDNRVVILLDLDGFYTQVERIRLNLDDKVPIGILQRTAIIATSHSARKMNVPKMGPLKKLKKICPSLVVVKTDLRRYREASREILNCLVGYVTEWNPAVVVERASIDEMYFDVSCLIMDEIRKSFETVVDQRRFLLEHGLPEISVEALEKERMMLLRGDESSLSSHIRLLAGSSIAEKLRMYLKETLDYTSSCGIFNNKLFAKAVADHRKPFNQTLLMPEQVTPFLDSIKSLRKIPGIGGVFFQLLEDCHITSFAKIRSLGHEKLEELVGDRAGWLWNVMLGHDHSPVVEKGPPKSIGVSRSFAGNPITTHSRFKSEMWPLLTELCDRINLDYALYNRCPSTLALRLRIQRTGRIVSRSTGIPPSNGDLRASAIEDVVFKLFLENFGQSSFSIGIFSMCTLNFIEAGRRAITDFFQKPAEEPVAKVVYEPVIQKPQTMLSPPLVSMRKVVKEPEPKGKKCDKCGKIIEFEKWEEHKDWHFAFEIQRRLDSESRKQRKKRSYTEISNMSKNSRLNRKAPKKKKQTTLKNWFHYDQ
ncbi:hypothetical protein PCE1_003327 [Barthelona sp. PCE]